MSTPTPQTKTLVIEKDMSHPPEKIWRALTQAPLIDQWLMSNDFQPVVGHKFTLRTTPMPNWNGIIEGEVLEVAPASRLSYTWNSMGLKSTIAWTLTPTKDGTHLRMQQSGFGSDQDYYYKGAAYGWQTFISGLERVTGGLS